MQRSKKGLSHAVGVKEKKVNSPVRSCKSRFFGVLTKTQEAASPSFLCPIDYYQLLFKIEDHASVFVPFSWRRRGGRTPTYTYRIGNTSRRGNDKIPGPGGNFGWGQYLHSKMLQLEIQVSVGLTFLLESYCAYLYRTIRSFSKSLWCSGNKKIFPIDALMYCNCSSSKSSFSFFFWLLML